VTVSFAQVRLWRADLVGECARSVAANRARLEALGSLLTHSDPRVARWDGEGAESAQARHTEVVSEHRRMVTAVASTAAVLERAAEQVAGLLHLAQAAEDVARRHGLTITDHGLVVTVPDWPAPSDPVAAQLASQAQERARWEVRDDLEQLLARAAEVDATLRGALVAAAGGDVASPVLAGVAQAWETAEGVAADGPRSPSIPEGLGGPGWTAWDNAAWWDLLTANEQEQVILEHPERVGPADGVPAWARDRANRTLLDRGETWLVQEQARLHPPPGPVPPLLPAGHLWAEQTGRVMAQLASVRALKAVVSQRDGITRQLLLVDISGRLTKAAVSVGDVDRARHVAVFVGGLTTSVNGDVRRYDTTMGQMTALAQRQSSTHGDGRDVAAVTWMGYEAPQWNDIIQPDRSVLLRRAAEAGAPQLARFANGLDAARAPGEQPHLTVWAHSYGSPTAGLALAGSNTGVDELAAFGSPGLGVRDTAQLHLPPGRLHVLETGDDVVADSGRFGRDPDHLPGADVLSTSTMPLPDGTTGVASGGHSEYLKPGSTSAWNIAAVAAGTPQLLVRGGRCGELAPPTDVSCRFTGKG